MESIAKIQYVLMLISPRTDVHHVMCNSERSHMHERVRYAALNESG